MFGTPHLPQPDADSERVGEAMNAYWARFARAGDPNGEGAPALWPEFKQQTDNASSSTPDWTVLENFRSKECAFWRKYYGVE